MKCKKCANEWVWQESMTVCPFCGNPIDTRRASVPLYNSDTRARYEYQEDKAPRRRRARRKKRGNGSVTAAVLLLAAALLYFGRYEISARLSEFISSVDLLPQTRPSIAEPQEISPPEQEQADIPAAEPADPAQLRYYRNLLSEDEKDIYDRIYAGVAAHDGGIKGLKTETLDRLYEIYSYVLDDNPELFWVDGGASAEWVEGLTQIAYTLKPNYTFSNSEYMQFSAEVETAAAPLLAQCAGLSDFDKVRTVYEHIINNTEYDTDYIGKSIYELFVQGRAVCTAYSRATQYLLNRLGIETLIITGKAGGENHAWNLVKLGGEYYELDTTWGDPVTGDGTQHINYCYFCITTQEMGYTHERSADCTLPVCTQTEYNYYLQTGRYLEKYDEATIATWLAETIEYGDRLEFKCADESVYEYTVKKLFSDKRIYTVFRMVRSGGFDPNSCLYSNNDELYIISIGVNRYAE